MNRSDLDKMRNQKQDKNSAQVNVYMFAAAFSMLDSVLYVSDIQLVNDVAVNNKWFLKERLAFEKQFNDYVAGTDNESYMTSVQFSDKEKKVIKNRERLIKRNKRKTGFKMYKVADFKFSNPAPEKE